MYHVFHCQILCHNTLYKMTDIYYTRMFFLPWRISFTLSCYSQFVLYRCLLPLIVVYNSTLSPVSNRREHIKSLKRRLHYSTVLVDKIERNLNKSFYKLQ